MSFSKSKLTNETQHQLPMASIAVGLIITLVIVMPSFFYFGLYVFFGNGGDALFSAAIQAALTNQTLAECGITFSTQVERNTFILCAFNALFIPPFYAASMFSLFRTKQKTANATLPAEQ